MENNDLRAAMTKVAESIREKYLTRSEYRWFDIVYKDNMSLDYAIKRIKENSNRDGTTFDSNVYEESIVPSGGVLFLKKHKRTTEKEWPILISEACKGQITKTMLKNYLGIQTVMNHEGITPYICFGSDINKDSCEEYQIFNYMTNLYPLNHTHVRKKDGSTYCRNYAPVSTYIRESEWTVDEMTAIMFDIAEMSVNYYLI